MLRRILARLRPQSKLADKQIDDLLAKAKAQYEYVMSRLP